MKIKPKAKSSSSSKDFPSLKNGNTSTNTESSTGTILKTGSICLAFLILGFQICLFIQHSVRLKIEAAQDSPDTVFVYLSGRESSPVSQIQTGQAPRRADSLPSGTNPMQGALSGKVVAVERHNSVHSPSIGKIREKSRKVETFPFNPNTVSVEDLQRLGFSLRQAQSIEAYRGKGGHFRRAADFAKSYAVSDSIFQRLEPYIDIPSLDINAADSAAFDSLPGIGPYFASKMVSYRAQLGGYSDPKQLCEIWNFGEDRYNSIADLIVCSPPPQAFRLWTLPADSLRLHPHIRYYNTAKSIVFFREHNSREQWTLEALAKAGIIDESQYEGLQLCRIAQP